MTEKQKQLLEELKKLVQILEKNDIWYSLTLGSLLGAWKFKGFIPWDDDIDLLIDAKGYEKLKELHPENIVNWETNGYPILLPKWIPDKSKIHESAVFIDLFVVVKTDMKQIKKFKSFRNKLRFGVYSMHHNYIPHTKALKTLKVVTWPLKAFYSKNVNYDQWVKKMDNNGSIFYYVNNPAQPNAWSVLPQIWSKETIMMEFEGLKVKGVKCYDEWLNIRYKKIDMTPPIGKKIQVHTNTYSVKYVEYLG